MRRYILLVVKQLFLVWNFASNIRWMDIYSAIKTFLNDGGTTAELENALPETVCFLTILIRLCSLNNELSNEKLSFRKEKTSTAWHLLLTLLFGLSEQAIDYNCDSHDRRRRITQRAICRVRNCAVSMQLMYSNVTQRYAAYIYATKI